MSITGWVIAGISAAILLLVFRVARRDYRRDRLKQPDSAAGAGSFGYIDSGSSVGFDGANAGCDCGSGGDGGGCGGGGGSD